MKFFAFLAATASAEVLVNRYVTAPVVTSLRPEFANTQPHVTTTLMREFAQPHVTTTLMREFAQPHVTTTLMPEFANAQPHITTTLMPEFANAQPHVTTTLMPEFANAQPHVVTTLMPEFAYPEESNGGVQISRTFNTLTGATLMLKINSGCTDSDAYGSNNCLFNWGQTVNGSVSGSLTNDITSGKLIVNLKIAIIPLAFTCDICGANCTFTIPLVDIPVNFALPDCPLKARTLPTELLGFVMPAKNPLGIGAAISGTVSATDQTGATWLEVTLAAKISN